MELFNTILLDVWREACKHIKITESLPSITAMLVEHLPLHQIVIRRIDYTSLCIDTIAAGVEDCAHGFCDSSRVSEQDITLLKQWTAKKELFQDADEGSKQIRDLLLPCAADNNTVAAPLLSTGQTDCVIVFIAGSGTRFKQKHIDMIRILAEPFTIAINNHRTITEMVTLREAAEADKKTLLAKLSRKQMGDKIIGADKGLKMVMKRVDLISGSDIPVLIFGETGSGKELIARAIHKTSGRPQGPFIRVNCGAIPPELIDSQLFGHEKGAFTGAVEQRKGWFERAHGGTLFLDEIGEMSLKAQVRLLRILQDGWLERVGAKNPIKVDVRTILATHRDIYSMVAQGSFREDLWYRISTFPIFLPPLRERLEDMADLAAHFAERSAIRFGLQQTLPTSRDIKLLSAYAWPGNIRELASVIDRAALIGNGHSLEIQKALGWIDQLGGTAETAPDKQSGRSPGQKIISLNQAVKNHIEFVLEHTHGKIEGENGAAFLLDINPHTLRAKMRKLGIDWASYRNTRA